MGKMLEPDSDHRSLSEVYETIEVPTRGPGWRRWLAVAGPALMVSVGYMDPGNWATDLAAGSRYNYALIWVLLMSNVMAILLQSLAARLGIARRRDLAQACREAFPPLVNIPLYVLAEIAITATDLAEVIGSAIALELLFGIPLLYGVLISGLDVLLLLMLSHYGIRKLEALILSLVGTIGIAFLVEIFLAQPDWGGIAHGMIPSLPDATALYIAIGILGATVMPHNLYLHTSLVQTRKIGNTPEARRQAIRLNTLDSAVALNLAFFINAAIMVMAAAVFFRHGLYEIAEIDDAHRLLEPILGTTVAPIAFAVALLASGQSSTITGTLAGQIVMEGFLNIRIRPWLRRLITRLLAIIPAVAVILIYGEGATGELLVLSQVVLSLQLPFAVIPLIQFVADRKRMGAFAIRWRLAGAAWVVAGLIVALNAWLVINELSGWIAAAGEAAWERRLLAFPLVAAVGILLLYITFRPLYYRFRTLSPGRAGVHRRPAPTEALPPPAPYRAIAVALDFSGGEERLLAEARRMGEPGKTKVYLLHVVESPVARIAGLEAADRETMTDRAWLEQYAASLRAAGFEVSCELGAGDPVKELERLVEASGAELLIIGSHGHRGLADVVHGSTVTALRHRVSANVLIVPLDEAKS